MMKTTNAMTLLRILFLAFIALPLYAQPGGMGGGRMGGGRMGGAGKGMGGQKMMMQQELTPEQMVASTGLFTLDLDAIVKKCKIKDDVAKKDSVKSVLIDYQRQFGNISFELNPQIDSLLNMKKVLSDHQANGQTDMMSQMRSFGGAIQKIRAKTVPMHNKLNEGMKSILSEKENKRWKSYYEDLCEDNLFHLKDRKQRMNSNMQRPQGMGGERRGRMPMGGGF